MWYSAIMTWSCILIIMIMLYAHSVASNCCIHSLQDLWSEFMTCARGVCIYLHCMYSSTIKDITRQGGGIA